MTLQLVEPHIDLLDYENLANLLKSNDTLCISIYMPTHRTSPARDQDPIRLKNLLSEAEVRLAKRGLNTDEINTLLEPAQRYTRQEEQDFWRYQSDGLAIFLAEDNVYIYRLPTSFSPMVYINKHFYIKPLLPVLDDQQRFYVLSLSQKNVRLFEGTRFKLGEVELSGIVTNFEDVAASDGFTKDLQFHSSGGSGSQPIYHGGRDAKNAMNQALTEFLRKIENHITTLLQSQHVPLILAGSDNLQGIYRNINDYTNLSEVGINTNPDALSDDELHQHAWSLIKPKLSQGQAKALGLYAQLAGKSDERAISQIQEVIPAAHFKRVDTLFVSDDDQLWGRFDENAQTVEIHDAPRPDNDELLNMAVIHTLLNGGTVYHVPEMPEDEPLQAILRY